MTQPDVQLCTAEVRQHARMVDEAADMCRDALAGAKHIDLHDEAYGELCSPLITSYLNTMQHRTIRTIRDRAQATAHLADTLRAMADSVDAADDRAGQRHQQSGRRETGK